MESQAVKKRSLKNIQLLSCMAIAGVVAPIGLSSSLLAQEEKKADAPVAKSQAADAKPADAPAAEKPKDIPGEMKGRVILSDLDNPAGIAIQPETGVVFVSNSGASQVVKIVNGKAEPVITDFPVDVYGKGPKYNIGPLGLLFLDKKTLVVGGGDSPDGQDLLRVYELPEDGKPVKADAMKASFPLAEAGEVKGEGNFYALAATADGIYVTCNGDDTKGWVSKAGLKGTKLDLSNATLQPKKRLKSMHQSVSRLVRRDILSLDKWARSRYQVTAC